jgi:hypothetical protein
MDELEFPELPMPATLQEFDQWCQRIRYREQTYQLRKMLLETMPALKEQFERDGLGHA